MFALIPAMNDVADRWLTAMWAVVWQLALVVTIAALIAWLLRRSSPVVRYWLWQIVAIKLLLMPFWTFAIPLPSWAEKKPVERSLPLESPIRAEDNGLKAELPKTPLPAKSPEKTIAPVAAPFWQPLAAVGWQTWLLALWCIAVAWLIARLLWQRTRLVRLLARATAPIAELVALTAELSRQIDLRRPPTVVAVDGDCPLFVCGLWRPRLVLPTRLMASLGAPERRQVILHELAHVKRHDLVWGWPIEIARIAYFFHPLVYWAAYQLRLERELACDQLAMARSGHTAADYAQTLVQVVSHASQPATVQVAAISAGLTGSEPSPKQPDK